MKEVRLTKSTTGLKEAIKAKFIERPLFPTVARFKHKLYQDIDPRTSTKRGK